MFEYDPPFPLEYRFCQYLVGLGLDDTISSRDSCIVGWCKFYETQLVNNRFSWLKLTIPFCLRYIEHYCRRFPWQFVYLERCKLYCKEIRWRSRKIQGSFIGYFKRSLSNASIVWVEWRWFNVSQIYFSSGTVSRGPNRQSDCPLSTPFKIAATRFGRPTFKVQILWRKVWRELPFMVFGCIKCFQ